MKIPLSDYMSLILESELNYLEQSIFSFRNLRKKDFNKKNLHILIQRNINKLKKIIKEKYEINNNVNITIASITDNMLLEAIKLYSKYDEERVNIIETNRKFTEYINTTPLNLPNYNKNKTTISTIIKDFRTRIKTKILNDVELEFIKYILKSSYLILKYDYKLMKTIE